MDSSKKSNVNYVSITEQGYDLLQRKYQETKERASKRIREALSQVEDANLKENESFQKLHVVNSNLEKSRKENESFQKLHVVNSNLEKSTKSVDQSFEQLEVA